MAIAITKPEVFIIESLDVDDELHHREGEVLSRTLTMSGKHPIYRYIRTKKELIKFVAEFKRSRYRYLHLSVHGNKDLIALTYDHLSAEEFAEIVGPALRGRRLFLSTCRATNKSLAKAVFGKGGCISVAGPVHKIGFGDAAIFWSSFYHLMFKRADALEKIGNGRRMLNADIKQVVTHLALAIEQPFRLFLPDQDAGAKARLLPAKGTVPLRERVEE